MPMSALGDGGRDARGAPDGYGFPLPPLSEEEELARKVRRVACGVCAAPAAARVTRSLRFSTHGCDLLVTAVAAALRAAGGAA
jgi:hypothetical protein